MRFGIALAKRIESASAARVAAFDLERPSRSAVADDEINFVITIAPAGNRPLRPMKVVQQVCADSALDESSMQGSSSHPL